MSAPSLATLRLGLEQLEARGSTKAVFGVLALAALPGLECWPTQRLIAQRTGFSVRTVRRATRELEGLEKLSTHHGRR